MESKEIWKSIKNYEGLYEISSLGDVKSINYRRSGKNIVLSKVLVKNGYLIVNLYTEGVRKTKKVHQLVAEAFLNHTPCGFKLVVNHKNFIKTDNRVENLEIITSRENGNKKHLLSSSKYIGVLYHKASKKWISQISINGRQIHLGSFNSETEASKYYENALMNHNLGLEIEVKKPNNSSKYKGVSWSKRDKKWRARIFLNKQEINLGSFKTELEAKEAYENRRKKWINDIL